MNLNKENVYIELKELRENAYTPYSNFRVSCVIYLKDGTKIKGVNVENAAYNPSICAERVALPQMIAQGYDKNDVELVALYTDSEGFGSPCGTCRQTLFELLFENQEVWVYNKNEFLGSFKVSDFLPLAFTNKNLNN
ncbi:cytidine deaminase [Spiroplasma diminutum]|uniref:Cytidine deaminase n=1 Tax=Spiroplasma diminutum CUAS-1 TaxID=1276221 RepID=S5MK07_9MOLU|nr:cytidine deaminase [Spiroplasma diminutum]AGR42295.1 cytidine deaminase [Spiroplasma diminutum CUAS-1]